MNRRERKHMEKQMGLDKYKKKMSRTERFQMMERNIENGKGLQHKMKETRRVQERKKIDETAANRISYIATDLMINHDVPFVEAQEQAKELYKKEI